MVCFPSSRLSRSFNPYDGHALLTRSMPTASSTSRPWSTQHCRRFRPVCCDGFPGLQCARPPVHLLLSSGTLSTRAESRQHVVHTAHVSVPAHCRLEGIRRARTLLPCDISGMLATASQEDLRPPGRAHRHPAHRRLPSSVRYCSWGECALWGMPKGHVFDPPRSPSCFTRLRLLHLGRRVGSTSSSLCRGRLAHYISSLRVMCSRSLSPSILSLVWPNQDQDVQHTQSVHRCIIHSKMLLLLH
ncbi:hypothetical protein CALVIDRAFT_186952 [Calocera viscosa TUFC12733]|uniref:Uncharacterized protein n=1 Tax=Calocera viscosa (strain TUFC12733) TaxID=1330018 RepID=A0A167KU96_CALVF|nr:hypothetical protein CALVIDRAFT_186952 [Calocera viscosa TUFC12733]